jgi:hypothetical protein
LVVNQYASSEAMMKQPHANYHAYLIRFWRLDNAGQPVWRVGVEEPGAQMPLYFENLAALCAFLVEQLGMSEGPAQSPPSEQDVADAIPPGGRVV